MAHGLMFHHFYDRTHPRGQGAISASEFESLIRWVDIRRILPAQEWQDRASKGTLGDDDLCLTFDDALRCQYDVAKPVLDSLGLTAFWFVYSSVFEGDPSRLEIYRYFRTVKFDNVDSFYRAFEQELESSEYYPLLSNRMSSFDPDQYLAECPFFSTSDRRFRYIRDEVLGPERYQTVMDRMVAKSGMFEADLQLLLWMDDRCLQELDRGGHVIGLHSYSHPTALAKLPPDIQRREYQKNFYHLNRVLEKRPATMSHPSNSYGPETLDILSEMGITLGFRAEMTHRPERSSLEYPREDHANIIRAMAEQ
jgi:peptidoglycan/xylan/chitin deacetylase (PgdA/CDA1 family)